MSSRAADIRRRRAELLAFASPVQLESFADQWIERLGPPVVDGPPTTGTVLIEVTESVCGDRFQLGEALVSEARVLWCGASGWAMRPGDDLAATLSAALADAAAQVDPHAAQHVDRICAIAAANRDAERRAEWRDLLATEVAFEVLDER